MFILWQAFYNLALTMPQQLSWKEDFPRAKVALPKGSGCGKQPHPTMPIGVPESVLEFTLSHPQSLTGALSCSRWTPRTTVTYLFIFRKKDKCTRSLGRKTLNYHIEVQKQELREGSKYICTGGSKHFFIICHCGLFS